MNQEHLRTLAYNCGAVPFTPPPLRAICGVSMTYEQLTKFAEAIKSGRHSCSSLCHPEEPCMLTSNGQCRAKDVP